MTVKTSTVLNTVCVVASLVGIKYTFDNLKPQTAEERRENEKKALIWSAISMVSYLGARFTE